MSRVYFHQKPSHRERQRDTYSVGKTLVEGFSCLSENRETSHNLTLEKKTNTLLSKTITKIIKWMPIINLRHMVPSEKGIDFIYTWGDIPFGTNIPYIIELDNPSILTLYNNFALKIYRPIISWLLSRNNCHKIVCISEACQSVFLSIFGEKFRNKTIVLPPYTEKIKRKEKADDKIRYVWIGLRNQGKGGRETIEAFRKLEAENIELHIIGWGDHLLRSELKDDTRIVFHGPLDRKKILSELLPNYDVFVFPTLYESLGMVALEALSAGLGIITTDTFALSEICHDGENGRLIAHPLMAKEDIAGKKIVNVTRMTALDFYEKFHITENSVNSRLVDELEDALEESLDKYNEWKQGSEKIYNKSFAPEIWKTRFLSLFS